MLNEKALDEIVYIVDSLQKHLDNIIRDLAYRNPNFLPLIPIALTSFVSAELAQFALAASEDLEKNKKGVMELLSQAMGDNLERFKNEPDNKYRLIFGEIKLDTNYPPQ